MGTEDVWGKMLGKMLRDQVGTEARPAGVEGALRLGDTITLVKREVKTGKESAVSAGQPMRGTLLEKIQIGQSFNYGTGNTSPVRSYRTEGDKLIIETETSVYELSKG